MGDEMGHGGTGRKDYALTSWTPSCARVTVESPGPITRQSERNETANADFHAADSASGQAYWRRSRRPCHQGTVVSVGRSDWRRTGE